MTDKDEFEDMPDLSDMAAARGVFGAGVSLEDAADAFPGAPQFGTIGLDNSKPNK
jgi:hypothetical protein